MKSLALQNVSVRFGAVHALRDVSIEATGGQVLLLAGPNGAGKSTLIRVLLGLVHPGAGVLSVDGRRRTVNSAFKDELGYLPEAVAFWENLTGFQVMRFFAHARQVGTARAREVLKRIGLEGAAHRAVRGYSRGMRQRLGLGVAIVGRPRLLILDEPTGGLDQEGLGVLWSVLDEWRESGRLVVVASHDLALMERRVDRVCLLRDGKVLAYDTPGGLRDLAALNVTVHFRSQDEASATKLAAVVENWGRAASHRTTGEVVQVEVPPAALISLLDLRPDTGNVVTAIRVEEHGLDAVYDHLLKEMER